jgi:hypothetical protein
MERNKCDCIIERILVKPFSTRSLFEEKNEIIKNGRPSCTYWYENQNQTIYSLFFDDKKNEKKFTKLVIFINILKLKKSTKE